jgi:hypothetical protein
MVMFSMTKLLAAAGGFFYLVTSRRLLFGLIQACIFPSNILFDLIQ